jgi:hypothetical protein
MNWELEWIAGRFSFAQLGIGHLQRVRTNQGRDVVSFRHCDPAALSASPLLPAFTDVRIYRDSGLWFSGIATELPAVGTANAEAQDYRIGGPWWHLESIVYQQPWNVASDPENSESSLVQTLRSHVVLGQGPDGMPRTLYQQLVDVLSYAIAAGAPLTHALDEESLSQTLPPDECRDLSCAEAIQRLLRWVPDARLWFDYGEEIPVLHCVRSADAPKLILSLSDSLQSLSITPRHDLQLAAVAIKYERTHSGGGRVWRTLEVDRYPANSLENRARVLVLTVELAGSRSQFLSQKIVTRPVSLGEISWWQRHLPALASVPSEDLQLLSFSRNSALPRELLEGGIADWMNVEAESDVARATIAYAANGTSVSAQEVAVRFTATDATTRTYAQLASFVAEEASPIGLARAIQESLARCPYEGTLRLVDGEVRPLCIGAVLRIVGGQEAWEEMDSPIQECREDVDGGTVTLRFGPPIHLGFDQLIQMTRMNRGREAPRATYVRASGEGAEGRIEQPSVGAVGNTHVGSTVYGRILLAHGEDSTRQISLDANLIGGTGLVLQPREEYVVEDGVLCKRLAIASQPYALENS